MPLKSSCVNRSSNETGNAPGSAARLEPTSFLFVSAPVGQEAIHSPHDTHEEFPIGSLRSNEILALKPLFILPSTSLWRTSLHARTQRSQRIQAL